MEYELEKDGKVKRYEISYSQELERRLLWAVIALTTVGLAILFFAILMIWKIDQMDIVSQLVNACG